MKILDDKQIVEQLAQGNQEAFKALFKKYYKVLNVAAFYILRDEMEAEDTVQALLMDFWEKQLYKNINSSLNAYLKTAIRNRCLKRVEKETSVQKKLTDYQYTLSEIEEEIEEVQEIYTGKILADLSVQRLQAVTLVHYQNKKYKQAAYEMGISINSLKTHLKLAIKILREGLKNAK
ncbi:sigma-70 family RNA polymerase sigma factor [Mucilaginibacter sp. FT3.2]|uniref:sigma-70 family RNA polymerase sigma factor n=1 Tax=Mucilaginibacter sp. FT3.2 TaxID=2723090 RepID=UPI00162152CB|nr:sigma-70 family RNA polymerase sigma factor [Mucilaginibacter sp. FT3.2]MBB6231969.1 RNA polymerase sigma-70 factor (ECF subfamily) [Mucilaginibacter sp. FT3.2]